MEIPRLGGGSADRMGTQRAPTIQACGPASCDSRWSDVRLGRAVLLDRDGTIIVDRPYDADPSRIELMEGAIEGLHLLRDKGYRLIVITNQSGVARGYYPAEAVAAMHARLDEMLSEHGIGVEAYYFCPHHVAGSIAELAIACACRKPEPGALIRAASDHGIDLARSWMIGNAPSDIAAAAAAGCRSALVGNVDLADIPVRPTVAGRTILDAARQILAVDSPVEHRSD